MPSHHDAPSDPRAARTRRRTRVRRGVATASLSAFALTWGVIAGSGSMGASTATASGSSAASSSAATEQTQPGWTDSSQSQPDDTQTQSSDLTTRQS